MIAVYLRVSSVGQRHDGQRAEIQRWLVANGMDGPSVQWFEDTESGSTLRRPGFEELTKGIFDGTVRTVICWKLDRLSRSLRDGINLIADWVERGVRVISVTQQIDLSGAVGRMVASVMFGLAEIEREHIRERQAVGIRIAKERGIYQGRQKGTTKAKPTRARELHRQGFTAVEVAQALGISQRTVFRYLAQAE